MKSSDYVSSITQRLEEIQNLKDGWQNGDGKSYQNKDIQWLEAVLISFADKIPEPKIYPWVNYHTHKACGLLQAQPSAERAIGRLTAPLI
jgi:hypothetical protein